MYICVPHETWYEKGIWPSKNNKDHKHSFTTYEKSSMPCNIVVKELLSEFEDILEVLEIRENLKNYDFGCDKDIDQTEKYENMVCAQIEFIVRKKKMQLTKKWRVVNNMRYYKDYWHVMVPIQMQMKVSKILPQGVKRSIKNVIILLQRRLLCTRD